MYNIRRCHTDGFINYDGEVETVGKQFAVRAQTASVSAGSLSRTHTYTKQSLQVPSHLSDPV